MNGDTIHKFKHHFNGNFAVIVNHFMVERHLEQHAANLLRGIFEQVARHTPEKENAFSAAQMQRMALEVTSYDRAKAKEVFNYLSLANTLATKEMAREQTNTIVIVDGTNEVTPAITWVN
ncbi:MAG: hypothetical protein ACT4OY_00405 [Alphaproteobacteria bacterium]